VEISASPHCDRYPYRLDSIFRWFRIEFKNGSYKAFEEIRERLPSTPLGIDLDNGVEFINHQLLKSCQTEKITFIRSQPSKKNDNCSVEAKNWTIVRKAVRSCHYEPKEELNELYAVLRLYTNFFQTVTK